MERIQSKIEGKGNGIKTVIPNLSSVAQSFQHDAAILDLHFGLGVLALFAQDKLADEAIQIILKLGSIMSTIDNPTIIRWVIVGLSAKFKTKVLDDI